MANGDVQKWNDQNVLLPILHCSIQTTTHFLFLSILQKHPFLFHQRLHAHTNKNGPWGIIPGLPILPSHDATPVPSNTHCTMQLEVSCLSHNGNRRITVVDYWQSVHSMQAWCSLSSFKQPYWQPTLIHMTNPTLTIITCCATKLQPQATMLVQAPY